MIVTRPFLSVLLSLGCLVFQGRFVPAAVPAVAHPWPAFGHIEGELPEDDSSRAAGQFLEIVLGNPRFGTAFDRVCAYHNDRGAIGDIEEGLCAAAGLDHQPAGDSGESSFSAPDDTAAQSVALKIPAATDPGAAAMLVGMLRLQHGEFATAAVALRKAADLRPDDPLANWYLGRALAASGKSAEAVTAFEVALAVGLSRVDTIEIHRELARTHQRSADMPAALAVWQRLETAFPGDLRVREQIAATLAADGRWQEALARYEHLAADTDDSEQRVQANLMASDMLRQLGRSQEAVTLLESQLKALDVDSWLFNDLRSRIESVYRDENDLNGLVSYYDAWISAHPDDVDAMGRLARILSLQNRSTEASDWYDRALKRAPGSIPLRKSLIEQLERDGRIADAIAQYEVLAQHDAGNLDHLAAWGRLYLQRTDLAESERRSQAAAVWERLLDERTDDAPTLVRVAELMKRAALTDRAIALYRQAVDAAPDEPQYREYLGEYLHQLQRQDEALAVWMEIADGERRTKENLVRLAEVLHSFGQTQEAIVAMREACTMQPELNDRLAFITLLRDAAHGESRRAGISPPSAIPSVTPNAQPKPIAAEFHESFEQLTLAASMATTPDERRQVLDERIKTLIAAGELQNEIARLSGELRSSGDSDRDGSRRAGTAEPRSGNGNGSAGASPSQENASPSQGRDAQAERWLMLALYHDAAEQPNEATEAARRAVELQPDLIDGWRLLASLHERTGRLGDAADAMRATLALDPRGKAESLRKIARLEVRLGRFDDAFSAAQELTRATPGNPEAWQFLADLCFEIGRPDDAMSAFRRAVRVNPGDSASLLALAKSLADDFHTPEAMDLYWRALEKAPDLDSQNAIIVLLSNLALRSNQFDRLIERLELRSRELNLPLETARILATAWREAGEFGKARESLERLRSLDHFDVSILRQLLELADKTKDVDSKLQYEQLIADALTAMETGDHQDDMQQQSADGPIGHNNPMRQLVREFSLADQLSRIDERIGERDFETAANAVESLLVIYPNNWEVRYREALLDFQSGSHEAATLKLNKFLQFDVDPKTRSILAGSSPAADRQHPEVNLTPNDLFNWTDSDSQSMLYFRFGECRIATLAMLLSITDPSTNQLEFDRLKSEISQLSEPVIPLAIAAIDIKIIAGIDRRLVRTNVRTCLRELHSASASALRLYLLAEEFERGELPESLRSSARAEAMLELRSLVAQSPEWLSDYGSLDPESVVELLRPETKELEELFATRLRGPDGYIAAPAGIAYGQAMINAELVVASLKCYRADLRSTDPARSARVVRWLNSVRTEVPLMRVLTRESNSEGLLDLVSLIMETPAPDRPPQLWSVSPFLVAESEFGQVPMELLYGAVARLVDLGETDRVRAWTYSDDVPANVNLKLRAALLQVFANSELEQRHAAALGMVRAAEGEPWGFRFAFSLAYLTRDVGLREESLLLLDSVHDLSADLAAIREQAALELSMELKLDDRTRLALSRLSSMNLPPDKQAELIPKMQQLAMTREVAAIEARLGRGGETRQSVLQRRIQAFQTGGRDDLAGEAAWELLKLDAGGALFSGMRPPEDRDDGGDRAIVLRVLGRLNRLQPLIDRYESMLAASPESIDLLQILCEFHDAAGQTPLLADKRDRIAVLLNKAPPSLKSRAVELEKANDVSGACDLYLEVLRSEPAAFARELETYLQSFERAKRLEDLLTTIIAADANDVFMHQELTLVAIASLAHQANPESAVPKNFVMTLLQHDPPGKLDIPSPQLLAALLARPGLISEQELLPYYIKTMQFLISMPKHNPRDRQFASPDLLESFRGLRQPQNITTLLEAAEVELMGSGYTPKMLMQHPHPIHVYLLARSGADGKVRSMIATVLENERKEHKRSVLSRLELALAKLGEPWTVDRIAVLERICFSDVHDPSESDTTRAEHSDALLKLYETAGRANDARRLVVAQADRMLLAAENGGLNGDQVRKLLQAAERIQHSGFPADALRLLHSVTPADLDAFATDLDEDKAIAFKSRFAAAERWARQQLTAMKLVEWLEAATAIAAQPPDRHPRAGGNPAAASESQLDSRLRGNDGVSADASGIDADLGSARASESPTDLLLEISGLAKSGESDPALLAKLSVGSLLLDAIARQSFDDRDLQSRVAVQLDRIVANDRVDLNLLAAAATFAAAIQDGDRLKAVLDRLSDEAVSIQRANSESRRSSAMSIHESLRGQPAVGLITMIRLPIVAARVSRPDAESLLQSASRLIENEENPRLRIALLNELAESAESVGLSDLAAGCALRAEAAIASLEASESAADISVEELRHEIRTRLLGLPE